MKLPSVQDRRSLLELAIAALTAAGAAAMLQLAGRGAYFAPYFGSLNPVAVLAAAALCGAIALRELQARHWRNEASKGGLLGIGVAALCATALAIPVMAVDARVRIEVANVPTPWSLLFYPSIAFVVEVFFHVAPLALMFVGLRSIARVSADRAALICIVLVSLIEPLYQVRSALADQTLSWLETYIWWQVWAVNLVQLYLFRRFGFASMYGMRLVYYFWWHIAWASVR